jgi:hypothetical protein
VLWKLQIVKALTISAALLISAISYTARADDPVGRFQLVSANVESTETGSPAEDRMLFKIDTTTGRTWYYLSTKLNGKLMEKWIEVEN